ncbi:sulfite exporter TauE/SafE family protein [Pseudomonas sp. UL073]|uniref:Probable membrane transporter protein n=1 Tax=Zestomonas insulae TaxID=2809017 RepID=A0ABS2IHF2_9GAMM|nr:sulfite exporter TauE/SafE family protein [Pseudomonas insulae]MBM7062501.1 sulfite exporter TauE/SafE family protein [Pseudomonas insulae]
MLEPFLAYLPLILAVFLLAGTVKGAIGLGLPTISVGLLGLVMPPMQAAAILVVPSMVTNLWQLADGRSPLPMLRRLWPLLAGIVVGTLLVGWLLRDLQLPHASQWLGVALLVYAALGLAAVPLRVAPQQEAWLAPLVGAVTGAITAVTGVFVIPAVPYLQAIGLEKDELVRGLGLSFSVSTLALALSLGHQGELLQPAVLAVSALALLPALLGMAGGQWLRRRVSAERFRRWFFIGLLLLGADLALRGLF